MGSKIVFSHVKVGIREFVDALADEVKAKTATQGILDDFHRPFIVCGSFCGFPLPTDDGAEGFQKVFITELFKDGVGNIFGYSFQPQCLFHLAAAPVVVFDFVIDEKAGEAFVVHIFMFREIGHVSGPGFLVQSPMLHFVKHLLRAVFPPGTECGELLQGVLFG